MNSLDEEEPLKVALLGTWQTGGRNVPAVLIADLGERADGEGNDEIGGVFNADETRLPP